MKSQAIRGTSLIPAKINKHNTQVDLFKNSLTQLISSA